MATIGPFGLERQASVLNGKRSGSQIRRTLSQEDRTE
jgi:hypothetical protein